jgi:hypothetical protein
MHAPHRKLAFRVEVSSGERSIDLQINRLGLISRR